MKKLLILLILLIPTKVFSLTETIVDITNLNIYEIQEYVDKGYLTYEQITRTYLERIEKYNKEYNAVISVNENIINEAKKLDEEYKKSGRKSLVYGLPILVKDNIDVVGLPTTNGAKGLLDSYPYKNAPIIQKLIDAGALIIGKANMDEFAFNGEYSHSSFGFVYNAYNTEYSAYGSSGGTAVGVATNLAVAGIGTDTGVSIRVPSAANSVVGLRPTHDIIDAGGIIKFEPLRDVAGPITKFVEDNAIILEIIDNTDKNYQNNLNTNNLSSIKIGIFKSLLNNSSSFIRQLMTNQIDKLTELGFEITYIDTFYLNYDFDATTLCWDFNEYIKGTNSKIKSLDDLIKNGNYTQYIDGYSGYYCNNDYRQTSAYKSYLNNRNTNIKTANQKFENLGIDVVIYPTIMTKLFLMDNIYQSQISTYSYSLAPQAGFPSINIPIGFDDGLPYGMEILSKPNNEDIIYKIAYNLQKQNNFYKLPDISPSLYEIKDNLLKLINYYEIPSEIKEYKNMKNKIKSFIDNYNNTENKDEVINNLILEYENIPLLIKENEIKDKQNKKKLNIIFTSLISLFVIISFILFKILKR